MRGDRDERQENRGHIALADFSLERWSGVQYVREMLKAGYFPLELDVWFWKERYYLYQVALSGNEAASGQLDRESVPLAQLLLQFPAGLHVELRASWPARVHSGGKQRTIHRDDSTDTPAQGLHEIYGGHLEETAGQKEEKGWGVRRVHLLNFGWDKERKKDTTIFSSHAKRISM